MEGILRVQEARRRLRDAGGCANSLEPRERFAANMWESLL
jgi:hypothetical protein